MPFRPEHLSYENVREEAAKFLAKYHPDGTAPVPIEEIVEFDLSMTLKPVLGIKSDLGVDAFLTSDLEYIFVEEWVMKHAHTRLRFSLAHEVGHYWLHDELYRESRIEKVADWRALQSSIGEEDFKWFEWQANAFAGLVLVPPDALRLKFNKVRSEALSLGVTADKLVHHPGRQTLIDGLADHLDAAALPHWLAADASGTRLVITSSGRRDTRVYLARLDPGSGALGRDRNVPAIDLSKVNVPELGVVRAVPHGAVFARTDPKER